MRLGKAGEAPYHAARGVPTMLAYDLPGHLCQHQTVSDRASLCDARRWRRVRAGRTGSVGGTWVFFVREPRVRSGCPFGLMFNQKGTVPKKLLQLKANGTAGSFVWFFFGTLFTLDFTAGLQAQRQCHHAMALLSTCQRHVNMVVVVKHFTCLLIVV